MNKNPEVKMDAGERARYSRMSIAGLAYIRTHEGTEGRVH